jgi:phosphoglycerate dehydrogenase-like enzyme
MTDERALAAMKPDAWLINVARGRLIDRRPHPGAARRRIGGAASTCSEETARAWPPFWDVPNLVVTPHTAWSSARVLDRSVDLFATTPALPIRRLPATSSILGRVLIGAVQSPSSGLPGAARRRSSTR